MKTISTNVKIYRMKSFWFYTGLFMCLFSFFGLYGTYESWKVALGYIPYDGQNLLIPPNSSFVWLKLFFHSVGWFFMILLFTSGVLGHLCGLSRIEVTNEGVRVSFFWKHKFTKYAELREFKLIDKPFSVLIPGIYASYTNPDRASDKFPIISMLFYTKELLDDMNSRLANWMKNRMT